MKRSGFWGRIVVLSAAAAITFSAVSCVLFEDSKLLPPGQAKKITGDDNAKDLAPGQNKK